MTTKVLVFSMLASGPGVASFSSRQDVAAGVKGGTFIPIGDDYETHLGTGQVETLRREDVDAKGYILNCGPKTLHVHYSLEATGEQVGPETDYVYPGSFKEIGAAKGVLWHIEEAD